MSILSNIFHKIFPSNHPSVANASPAQSSSQSPSAQQQAQQPASPTMSPSSVNTAPSIAMSEFDVEAILNKKAQEAGQSLNWRSSIVDLLKVLQLDSSLQARKELAQELHYTGNLEDSASMNVWLHRQVMNKLAANGGKAPADLKS